MVVRINILDKAVFEQRTVGSERVNRMATDGRTF